MFDDEDEINNSFTTISNELFIELMRQKLFQTFDNGKTHVHKVIVIYCSHNNEIGLNLYNRLVEGKYSPILSCESSILCNTSDIVVGIDISSDEEIKQIEKLLIPGGLLIIDQITIKRLFDQNKDIQNFDIIPSFSSLNEVKCLRKKYLYINDTSTVYWKPNHSTELTWLEKITVRLSCEERKMRLFSDITHKYVTDCMKNNGMCIFKNLYDSSIVLKWGLSAIEDMKSILQILKTRGIDLFETQTGDTVKSNTRIENYYEMSMREARRCDIRNGREMKKLASLESVQYSASKQSTTHDYTSPHSDLVDIERINNYDIRHHLGITKVLREISYPWGGEVSRGNWGRWNFEGPGPDGPPPELVVGVVGAVVSLPGCADQTIHSDTAHLFAHTELPGHYFNLFLPGVSSDPSMDNAGLEVGQTAFIIGSHTLQTAYDVMVSPRGNKELLARLVRPHLEAGDAILFDCRILHLGLANRYETTEDGSNVFIRNESSTSIDTRGWRPLLYINYHQSWFVDPKNWNTNERLFS
jgi:hypothetical protein